MNPWLVFRRQRIHTKFCWETSRKCLLEGLIGDREDNIKMDLKYVGFKDAMWVDAFKIMFYCQLWYHLFV
jgi:hypothetical protein